MKKTVILSLVIAIVICLCACGGPKEVTDLQYTTTVGSEEYIGLFTGTVIDKIPNGDGKFVFSDSSISIAYSGRWENGVLVGVGNLEYDGFVFEYNGDGYVGSYSGEAVNGIPNGNGTVDLKSNNSYLKYSGHWENGEISGKGYLESDRYVVRFLDGVELIGEYKGDILDGLASGFGIYATVNSDGIGYTYTGEWENGLYNGTGKIEFEEPYTTIFEGNYLNGLFSPTPLQFFVALGTYKDEEYEITKNATSFLGKYPEVFNNNTIEGTDIEFEENFKYEAFAKNPEKFGEKLIKIPKLSVVQIFEYSDWGYDYTFCIAQDSSYNVYYIYMLGYADDIYEGSRMTLTALPLDYFTYPNTAGNKIWAIACAAVSME